MARPDRLEAALARLSAALSHLEAAAERMAKAEAGMVDIRDEFALLQEDRSRLAMERDAAVARHKEVLAANHAVSARLARAGGAVEAILASLETAAPAEPVERPAEAARTE